MEDFSKTTAKLCRQFAQGCSEDFPGKSRVVFFDFLDKCSETSVKLQGYFGQVNTLVPAPLVGRETFSRIE